MKRCLCVVLMMLVLTLSAVLASAEVQVFSTRSGEAVSLSEALRAQMPESAKVTAYRDKVIVNGTKADIRLARQLLDALDKPPTLLTIHVKQLLQTSQAGSQVGGRVRIGPGPDQVEGFGQRRLGNQHKTAEQRLKVLLGESAFIQVGEQIPYQQSWAAFQGDVEGIVSTVDYTSVNTGFVVRPFRIQGNKVLLELAPEMAQARSNGSGLARGAPRIQFQRLATTVEAPIGEWFPLSTHLQRDDQVSREILLWQTGRGAEQREVWLRIDP